jgi:hypothetical protein
MYDRQRQQNLILIHTKQCHIFGVCMTYKNGFWIWWSNLLDVYTTCYDISQITIFDWTASISDHTSLIHSFWSPIHSLLYSLGSDLAENTSIAWQWTSTIVAYCCTHYLATRYLPRICLSGKVFIKPLPNNGSIRHNSEYSLAVTCSVTLLKTLFVKTGLVL